MLTRFIQAAMALALAGVLAAGASPAAAQEESDQPTISTVGCLDGFPDDLRFEDTTGVYRLIGKTASLAPDIGLPVEITGVPHAMWLATPGRAIEVITAQAVKRPAAAALDPVGGDPARWHSERDPRWGVSIAFPGERLPGTGAGPRPRLPIQDDVEIIHRSLIPSSIFPRSDFAGGYLAVFADPELGDAERCAAASPRSGRAPSFSPNTLTIGGVDYGVDRGGGAAPGSSARSEYLRTYHNGICFEFAFLFMKSDKEEAGPMGCMVAGADPSVLARLIVSEISFFPPDRGAAAR